MTCPVLVISLSFDQFSIPVKEKYGYFIFPSVLPEFQNPQCCHYDILGQEAIRDDLAWQRFFFFNFWIMKSFNDNNVV